MNTMQMGQTCLAPRYRPPVSASEADATILLIVWKRMYTRPFYFLLNFHTKC